jgi:hypothetical protein
MKPSGKKAKPVRKDSQAGRRAVDALDYADAVRGITAGLADVAACRTPPASAALDAIRKKHRIPRSK